MEEIIKYLKSEKGYKEFPQKKQYELLTKILLQKKVDSDSVCETNDSLSVDIHISKFELNNCSHEGYNVEIRAEKNGKWWTLNCYSLTRDEIANQISSIEETLIRLFNSL